MATVINAGADFVLWADKQLGYKTIRCTIEVLERARKVDLGKLYLAYKNGSTCPIELKNHNVYEDEDREQAEYAARMQYNLEERERIMRTHAKEDALDDQMVAALLGRIDLTQGHNNII